MIIEVDKYKEMIDGYDPARSDDVHIQSAKMADKDFENLLKTKKFTEIIFMSGGTASGKSEFAIQNYRESQDILVLDATLKNIEGFKIKYKLIKKYQKEASVKIVHITPENLMDALGAFFGRERKMNIENFWITHVSSKKSISKIIEMCSGVLFDLYLSVYSDDFINFEKVNIERLTPKEISNYMLILANQTEGEAQVYKSYLK